MTAELSKLSKISPTPDALGKLGIPSLPQLRLAPPPHLSANRPAKSGQLFRVQKPPGRG
jgi:hypothetical protein